MERLTDADLRMARRLATKRDPSAQNINSVLAIVPALVEEIEVLRKEHAELWDALQFASGLVDWWAPKDGVRRTEEWRALLAATSKEAP